MNKQEFQKFCKNIFKQNGFTVKGTTHFYKKMGEDILLVIALQHSSYSAVYYFDGGIAIESINQHMPYPKFYDVNIRCLSIKIGTKYAFDYENMDNDELDKLANIIHETIIFFNTCTCAEELKKNIIGTGRYDYCKDYNMQDYFGGVIPAGKLLPERNQM